MHLYKFETIMVLPILKLSMRLNRECDIWKLFYKPEKVKFLS